MSGLGERRGIRAVIYCFLVFVGWLTSNLLLSIGVVAVGFWVFANASAFQFFAEAENLARHFVAASDAERLQFMGIIQLCFLAVYVLFCVMRFGIVHHLIRDLMIRGLSVPHSEGLKPDE